MEITTEELKMKIENGEQIMVDFWGGWCGPCKILKPNFTKASDQLKSANANTGLYTFDIDKDRDFVMSLGIRSIPTIKGYKNGVEVLNKVGIISTEQIIELANNL